MRISKKYREAFVIAAIGAVVILFRDAISAVIKWAWDKVKGVRA